MSARITKPVANSLINAHDHFMSRVFQYIEEGNMVKARESAEQCKTMYAEAINDLAREEN